MKSIKHLWALLLVSFLAVGPVNAQIWPGPQPGGGGSSTATSTPSVVHYGTTSVSKGSTNTLIARFPTEIETVGSDITFTDSATLGSYATINTSGRYLIQFSLPVSASAQATAIKKNTSLNNTITNTDTDFVFGYMTSQYTASGSFEILCAQNDLIWVASLHTLGAYPELMEFYIRGPL